MVPLIDRIRQFIEDEARSCSMDYGCVTAEYVYRMIGGRHSMEEIDLGLTELRKQGFSFEVW
jgi:hypothetical protein